VVGVAALLVGIRLALVFAIPIAVHQVGEVIGLDIRLHDHRLSLLEGELELRGLTAHTLHDAPVAELERVRVNVSLADLLDGGLVVERVEVEGVHANLERDHEGRLTLVTTILEALGPSSPDEDEPDEETDDGDLPRIEVQRAQLRGVHLTWTDRAVTPPVNCSARLDTLTVVDWKLAPPFLPRLASVELGVNGVLDALRVEVLMDEGTSPWISAEVSLEGANPGAVRGYLTPLGLEPTGDAVDLFLAARTPWTGPELERAELNRLELTVAGRRELLLDSLLADVDLSEARPRVRSLELGRLVGGWTRRADGALLAAGLALEGGSEADATAAGEGDAEPAEDAGDPLRLLVDRLRLDAIALRLDDRTQEPPRELALEVDHAQVLDFELDLTEGATPRSASFDVALSAPGVVDSLALIGSGVPSLTRPRLSADLSLDGLRGEGLEPYLAPAGIAPIYTAASARLSLGASVAPSASATGHWDLACSLRGVDLSDGERTWLRWDRLEFAASDVSPVGSSAVVERLALSGLSAEAERRADGAVLVAGLAFLPASASPDSSPPRDTPDPPSAEPSPPLAELIPELSLKQLDLSGEELSWITPRRRTVLRSWRLHTERPWSLPSDPALAAPLPLALELRGGRLTDRVTLLAQLLPFSERPRVALQLEAHGIHGDALARAIGTDVRAAQLTDGELAASVVVEARGSLLTGDELPLLDATLREVHLEGAPGGPQLFALEKLVVSGVAFTSSGIAVDEVDVESPVLSARRSDDAVEVCGLRFPLQRRPVADVEVPPGRTEPQRAPPAKQAAGPSFTLRAFDLEGLIVRYTDAGFQPPIELPLEGGALSLRHLRWPPTPGEQLRATLRFEGGKLDGARGHAFDVLEVRTDLDLQDWTGTANLELSSLELTNLQGAAKPRGVELGGGRGTLDLDVRLTPSAAHFDSELLLNDLRLSEPAGGPLSSILDLPLGLDSALFLLRDEQGLIVIPFSMELPREGLSTRAVIAAGLHALGIVIGRAALRSPLRGLNSLKDLGTGFLGLVLPGEAPAAESIQLACLPGGVSLDAQGADRLERLLQRARRERLPALRLVHHPGAADAAAMQRVLQPSEVDLRLAQARIDARLVELEYGVGRLQGQLQDLGEEEQAEGPELRAQLRELEAARLALIESQDEVCELFAERARERSERSWARRVRRRVVRLGANRLEEVAGPLLRVPGVQLRVERPTAADDLPAGPGYVEVKLLLNR